MSASSAAASAFTVSSDRDRGAVNEHDIVRAAQTAQDLAQDILAAHGVL